MLKSLSSSPVRRHSLLTAIGVALAAVGCAPGGAKPNAANLAQMRHSAEVVLGQGMTVSYLRAGDPRGPRLILVHGTPGSADAWAEYLLNPPPGLEVVALDRPGFGLTEPSRAMPSLADQAQAVRALFPTDGRTVLLLGHSLGGPVVARVAADIPAQVAGVVLLAASLDPALEKVLFLQRLGALAPVRWLLPRVLNNANTELMALKEQLQILAQVLPQIRSKVLIVHGTKDDLVPFANVAFMQAKLVGAQCVETRVLEGRNHFLPWNAQDEVRSAIQRIAEMAC